MDVDPVAVTVIGIVVIGVVMGCIALRADMTDRFSVSSQKRNQEFRLRWASAATRERKLLYWVVGLLVSFVTLSMTAAASVVTFLAESAKDYGTANDTLTGVAVFGMVMTPLLAITALYHAVGMAVRLRAWRQVLAESHQQSESSETL